MRRYRDYQYEIEETNDVKYIGIINISDGKDVLHMTGEHEVSQGAYIELTKIINKILDESNKPK